MMWYNCKPQHITKETSNYYTTENPTLGYHILDASMFCCFIIQKCFWTSDSNNPLHLLDPVSPIAYGNNVVVVGCIKLATSHTNIFCCLLLKNFNAKRQWYCKGGNFTLATKVRKNLVDSINYIFIFFLF